MTNPTLRALAELPLEPPSLAASTLVLLDRARSAGIPIIHVQHSDGPGSLYDIDGESGAFVAQVAPRDGEPVVAKQYPNSFVETDGRPVRRGGARRIGDSGLAEELS